MLCQVIREPVAAEAEANAVGEESSRQDSAYVAYPTPALVKDYLTY